MTERFVYYTHKNHDYILDTPCTSLDFIEMLGDALSTEEIVDLLNALNDENEHLIRKRGELETKNTILKGENEHLKEENQKLRELLFDPRRITNEVQDE